MTDKSNTAKTEEPKEEMSQAEQKRMEEFRRTRKVPTGYTYNVRDGLFKTPKKDK